VSHPIRVEGLTKDYHISRGVQFNALKDLDFTVKRGEVFGFLGLNGAGKTTTLKILTTVMEATSGNAWISQKNIKEEPMEVRKILGFMPENPGFYPTMSGLATLEYFARFYHDKKTSKEKATTLIEKVGLTAFAQRNVETYSHGMKKRLALAASLVNDPEVLILDEPTSGLDPRGINQFKMMIRALGDMGITVMFSSHALADVEEVCDRVLIINKGRLVTIQRVEELRDSFISKTKEKVVIRVDSPLEDSVIQLLKGISGVEEVSCDQKSIVVIASAGSRVAPEVNFNLAARGVRVLELKTETPPLEKLFLEAVEGLN